MGFRTFTSRYQKPINRCVLEAYEEIDGEYDLKIKKAILETSNATNSDFKIIKSFKRGSEAEYLEIFHEDNNNEKKQA